MLYKVNTLVQMYHLTMLWEWLVYALGAPWVQIYVGSKPFTRLSRESHMGECQKKSPNLYWLTLIFFTFPCWFEVFDSKYKFESCRIDHCQ